MPPVELSEVQWRTLEALVRGLIPPLDPSALAGTLDSPASEAELANSTPVLLPSFRPVLAKALSKQRPDAVQLLLVVLNLLSYRVTALPLTHSPRLLVDMTPSEVMSTLDFLRHSRFAHLRQLSRGILDLAMLAYLRSDPRLLELIGYIEPNPWIEELRKLPQWVPAIEPLPQAVSTGAPVHLSADVVIVGSGCSAVVVAYKLVQQGFSVLILEKGKHFSIDDIGKTDFEREDQVFESGGFEVSSDTSMVILAGSTVGGGGAVNWSCSLATPEPIRKEFVRLGAPLFGTPEFDRATDHVWNVMHTTTDIGAPHSHTNQVILNSSKALGYPAAATGQNTGKHLPNNHFLAYGQRHGADKGGIAEWLRFALDNGAKLISGAQVVSIRHHNGRASGVDAIVNGSQHLIVNAKRVVCAAGSLHTPVLLQRSHFKNKHIGRGLKLHPVTLCYGEYPTVVVNKPDDVIMTAVCTQSDNLDGHYHGPKIEAIHHMPTLVFKFMPYRTPQDWRRKVASYRRLSALLIITRDKGEGYVSFNRQDPSRAFVDYTTSDYDLWALLQGCLTGANLHYIGGAERIILPLETIPDFVSSKPKHERNIWDSDYQAWYRTASRAVFRNFDVSIGSAHQMASCRMSDKGPRHGAVDARGRLYECQNVHVVDTSIFPSASGVNPMITCMAAAEVLAGYLVEELGKTLRASKL